MTRSDRPTAYHEAGHAFIWIQTKTPFERVAILSPEEDIYCAGKVFHIEGTRGFHDAYIAMLLSGYIAQAKYQKVNWKRFIYTDAYEHEYTPDYYEAFQVAQSHPYQKDVDRTMQEVGDWTRDTINANWKSIVKIAETLLDRRSLTYDEVVGLLTKKSLTFWQPTRQLSV